MNDLSKQALRKFYKQQRKNQTPLEQQIASAQICSRIHILNEYHQAKRLGLYHAMNGEIDLNLLWQLAQNDQKLCYFPKINPDLTLSFLPATHKTRHHKNRFGIDEPDVDIQLAIPPESLDILIIPLVAFDEQGTRLGTGGGYYDRTLATHKPSLLMGVAFDFQRMSFIQPDTWDIPLTIIITPTTTYWS